MEKIMPILRDIIHIDEEKCTGCGLCVPSCAEGAIQIVNGKARLKAEKYCDGLGACLGHCPEGALTVIKAEADPFDEDAVHAMLAVQAQEPVPTAPDARPEPLACGCPGSMAQVMPPAVPSRCPSSQAQTFRTAAPRHGDAAATAACLGHWPVKLRLMPENAPFLRGADLVLAADCSAVALPGFHATWLPERAVALCCPKFEESEAVVTRLAGMFRTAGVRSLTVMEMEVPCCSALSRLVAAALTMANAPCWRASCPMTVWWSRTKLVTDPSAYFDPGSLLQLSMASVIATPSEPVWLGFLASTFLPKSVSIDGDA